MTTSTLSPERYLQLVDADTERLIAMGERGLTEQVPSCPGWDVAEVVWHTAVVFEHKVRVMADNAWPDPWPPADFEEREELAFLREAKDDLFLEFARHDPAEVTETFSSDDNTIAFWMRRMALEVAVHRVDGELAHGDLTPVPVDLAVDGIDEALRLMLGRPSRSHDIERQEHPVDAVVAVESESRRWLCDIKGSEVTITDDAAGNAAATISGPADSVFLWLWGRAGDDAVTFGGDSKTVTEFRARLAEATQ
ncbi:MAG: maleylpyruvate isomerase family mycothiol-dependent enzyme [Nocardioidaceae bacterium]